MHELVKRWRILHLKLQKYEGEQENEEEASYSRGSNKHTEGTCVFVCVCVWLRVFA